MLRVLPERRKENSTENLICHLPLLKQRLITQIPVANHTANIPFHISLHVFCESLLYPL